MNKKISKTVLILVITLILALGRLSVTFAVTLPILESLKTYRLVTTYEINNNKNGDSGNLLNTKAVIKIGSELNSRYIINVSGFSSPEGSITKDENGNYILTHVIRSIAPNTSHSIMIERTFTMGTIDYNIDKSTITSDYSELPNYINYLKADIGIEVNDAAIQAKAKELTQHIANPYDKAFSIFRFVNTSITYNLSSQYANKGALSALIYKQGVCEEYSQLFVALCRASGIPARTVSGFRKWNTGIDTTIDLTDVRHMWAEFYLPNYGWTIAEPTVVFSTGAAVSDNALMNYFGKALNPAEHIATIYKTGNYDGGANITSNYDRTTTSKPSMNTTSNSILYLISDEISTATTALIKAESSKLQADVDSAQILINSLPNGITKTGLNDRLDTVQNIINNARSKFPGLSGSPFLATQDTRKAWNIKLNQPMDKKTVTTANISMKNSKGQVVGFNVESNEAVITIRPINKFEIGEQYVVYISDKVLSINGKGIKDGYYFTFAVN